MAAGNFKWFSPALLAMGEGALTLPNKVRVVLLTAAWTPNQNVNDAWGDISANEVANGAGYATHGKALTGTWNQAVNVVTFDADDQTWSAATITAKYAVLVEDDDNDGLLAAGDVILGYADLNDSGGSVTSTAGNFTITWNSGGILRMTAN